MIAWLSPVEVQAAARVVSTSQAQPPLPIPQPDCVDVTYSGVYTSGVQGISEDFQTKDNVFCQWTIEFIAYGGPTCPGGTLWEVDTNGVTHYTTSYVRGCSARLTHQTKAK